MLHQEVTKIVILGF